LKYLREIVKDNSLHNTLSRHYNYDAADKEHIEKYREGSTKLNYYHHGTNQSDDYDSPSLNLKGMTKATDALVSKHKTPVAMTVHSGTTEHFLKNMNEGRIHSSAYLSASLDKGIADKFAKKRQYTVGHSQDENGAMKNVFNRHTLSIHVPKGHEGAYLGHVTSKTATYNKEKEFVLPRNTKLRHLSTEKHIYSTEPKPTLGFHPSTGSRIKTTIHDEIHHYTHHMVAEL
jgi:hypothetical protein